MIRGCRGYRSVLAGLAGVWFAGRILAQTPAAEASRYTHTSTHAEVVAYLDTLAARGAPIRTGLLATSVEGRAIPYVIASRPLVEDPVAAHRTGKPVVLLQGNIHGGEVEGKEALQELLRDLSFGPLRGLLDSLIVLVVPIYNTDGNDAFGPNARNRPAQNGPDPIGRRPNGQGLDLNRDYVKQEAPETEGAAAFIARWDPDLFMDLHTTNGSYHGYVLTYAPGLNPNSPPLNDYVRERLLPAVRERMRARYREEIYSYGNFRNQNPDSLTQGWETYDPRPRFGTNWMGMRGRISILSEAFSHADFATRVHATYHFVVEVLRAVLADQTTIRTLVAASDRWRPDSVVTASVLGPARQDDVIAEITEPAGEGGGGFAPRRRTGIYRTIRMPVYDRFVGTHREAIPAAYLLPPSYRSVAENLARQGVVVEETAAAWSGPVEGFAVDSLTAAPQPFEGHRTVSAFGRWRERDGAITPGWFVVSTDQRLGVLAAYLLEPGSEDGFVTWNVMDRTLRPRGEAPVLRVRSALGVPGRVLR